MIREKNMDITLAHSKAGDGKAWKGEKGTVQARIGERGALGDRLHGLDGTRVGNLSPVNW